MPDVSNHQFVGKVSCYDCGMEKCSAIILAGGASTRMGTDKAFLELGGMPLIARVMERVRVLADEVVISANDAARFAAFDVRVVSDVMPNAGPLAGICAGLEAIAHPSAIVVACDMPLLNVALLEYMRAFVPDFDVVLPQTVKVARTDAENKGHALRAKDLALHPLHAIYTTRCRVPMRDALARGDRRMISFHDAVRVRVISPQEVARFDPRGYSLWNVNTPEKWRELQNIFRKL